MKRQEYNNLKERIDSKERVRKWYNDLTLLIHLHPNLKDLTLEEVKTYFSDRILELEKEIQETLNVE